MDYNDRLFLELSLLYETIKKENSNLKFRLDNDEEFTKDTYDLDNVTFGRMLYCLTKGLTNKELLDMSDDEMVRHIQVLQITEKG